MAKPFAAGIDIGGTKISMTIGDRRGRILAHHVIPTGTGSRTSKTVREIILHLKQLVSVPRFKNKIAGIGIGIPGPVDPEGPVPFSPNLKGWEGLRLKKLIEKKLRLPVTMANDADAAALGEKIFGQGRNTANFIYMTVSTGVGSGIILRGKLVRGESFVAGEVGHMKIVADGARCKCGKKGCLEAYASGTGMVRMAKEILSAKQIRSIVVCDDGKLTGKAIGLAARKRNAAALRVVRNAGSYLGIGIANLLNILNPEKIILGGGVFKSVPQAFWTSMMSACKQNAWPQAFKAVKIVHSRLRGHVGDLGALALVFEGS